MDSAPITEGVERCAVDWPADFRAHRRYTARRAAREADEEAEAEEEQRNVHKMHVRQHTPPPRRICSDIFPNIPSLITSQNKTKKTAQPMSTSNVGGGGEGVGRTSRVVGVQCRRVGRAPCRLQFE